MLPFKLEEVEITARVAVRIVAANLGASLVNCAAPFTLVKKHAHRFVDTILAVSQYAHSLTFVRHLFCEFVACDVDIDRMVLGQPRHIGWLGFNVVVATAVARAFATVKRIFLSHGALISIFRLRC